jgi:hypothetical protein
MTLAIYPTVRGLTWPVKKVPEYSTLEPMGSGGYRNTVPLYQNPIWHWELKYGYLNDDPGNILAGNTDTDYKTLVGFFLANQGVAGQFLYFDPADHIVGPALVAGVGNPNCALPVINDGAGTLYTPLRRNMGGVNINGFEDITDLVAGTLSVFKADGTPISPDWVVNGPGLEVDNQSFEGIYLLWGTDPGVTTVYCQFQFYFRAAFEKDDDFETDWITSFPNRFTASSLKIKSVRAASQV